MRWCRVVCCALSVARCVLHGLPDGPLQQTVRAGLHEPHPIRRQEHAPGGTAAFPPLSASEGLGQSWWERPLSAGTRKWERPLSAGTRKRERPLRYALLARSTSNSQILRMASRNASIMVRLLLRSPRDPTLRACTHTLAHARVHMCVRTHALARTPAHTRARTHARTHSHARTRAHARVHMCVRTHALARTHAHTRARTHAHTRVGLRRLCGRGLRLSGLGKAKGR